MGYDQKPEEERPPKPYPKSVFFIIGNEFCERFSFYGMKTILMLYLTTTLLYSDKQAKDIFHGFSMAAYFTPVLGAILADSLLGKFKTIFYISIIYVLGNIAMSLSPVWEVSMAQILALIGLTLVALGTGGIKPCVSAFGGDQFEEGQEKQLQTFFSLFYLAINSGSLISTLLTPLLKNDVKCFGKETCYPLAFGVPAVLMIVALIIFLIGSPAYKKNPPTGNIFFKVAGVIYRGISKKMSCSKTKYKSHWLDYAEDKYDKQLIEDVKGLLHVLVLYLPLPLYWALFDQQGSTWTLQAQAMNGKVFGYTVIPDQMQVLNPVLIVTLIPLFEYVIYPVCAKFNFLVKPLQRMAIGGLLASASFGIAAMVQIHIDQSLPPTLEPSMTRSSFLNNLDCTVNVTVLNDTKTLPPGQVVNYLRVPLNASIEVQVDGVDCIGNNYVYSFPATDSLVHFLTFSDEGSLKVFWWKDVVKKPVNDTAVMFLQKPPGNASITDSISPYTLGTYQNVKPEEYTLKMNINSVNYSYTLDLQAGGRYVAGYRRANKEEMKEGSMPILVTLFPVIEPNSVHMFYLSIQYLVITIGEILFSITGLEFSYSQAPASMKSVLQALWLLTVAFGNLIVLLVNRINISSKMWQLLIYAFMMAADMLIFMVLAYFYKPIKRGPTADGQPSDKQKSDLDGPPKYVNALDCRPVPYTNAGFEEDNTKL